MSTQFIGSTFNVKKNMHFPSLLVENVLSLSLLKTHGF